jgi:septin family protein
LIWSQSSEIGFATLPQHLHRKYAKKGFEFTILVVGESGLGKSTLISCLFLSDLYKDRKLPSAAEQISRTVSIEKKQLDIIEKGVKLKVTIVDTPGYGDSLDSQNSFETVNRYIEEQFEQYFRDESGLNRKNIVDNRVHCCLYFISPTGRGLSQLDILFMRQLCERVNIIPIIARADTLTPTELLFLKKKILKDLTDNGISIFKIPECDSDEDEAFRKRDQELRDSIPYAIVASTTQVDVNGRKTRARVYPWGVIDIQDESFSDFIKLKTFLSLHMQDLKDATNETLYENYRALYLSKHVMEEKQQRDDISAERMLQIKEQEIRKMQEQLQYMKQALQHQHSSGVNSGAQSVDSLSPVMSPRYDA